MSMKYHKLKKKKSYIKNKLKEIDLSEVISGMIKFSFFLFFVVVILIKKTKKQALSVTFDNKINNTIYKENNNVSFINGQLLWMNGSSINEDKIKEEIKEYNQINISFENPNDFIQRKNPLISLVITLYNQQDFIDRVYYSIQRQDMKDIELIFVDDASTDNSSKRVKELMEKDKRIVYLKNDINRKAFYSRNYGILNAKGEYLLVIDPDDILLNNILSKSYQAAKKYNLDIVQFYIMMGYFDVPAVRKNLKYKSGILRNNSEIRNFFYNGLSKNLVDKLIKREIYQKSVGFMRKEFSNGDYHITDDYTALFGVIHYAETYGFLEQIGYFYIARPPGPNHYRAALNRTNDLIYSICNVMKYVYYQSDNNTLEKVNVAYKYFNSAFREFGGRIQYLTSGFDYILDVFNLYLNCSFFNQDQKNNINGFKKKIVNRKNQLNLTY